jgi:hypothetical protein
MKKSAKKKRTKALTVEHPTGKVPRSRVPELKPDAELKPNRFAAKIARDGGYWMKADGAEPRWVPYKGDGRPKKSEPSEPSKVRSVRLPDSVWQELQARAKRRGMGVHTLLRELVAKYLTRAA